MYHYVYQITNILNGMIYIGARSSIKPPEEDPYMGSGVMLRKDKKRYGKIHFNKTILHVYDNRESAFDMEAQLVDRKFVGRRDTYNLTKGGAGGIVGRYLIDEARAKVVIDNNVKRLPIKQAVYLIRNDDATAYSSGLDDTWYTDGVFDICLQGRIRNRGEALKNLGFTVGRSEPADKFFNITNGSDDIFIMENKLDEYEQMGWWIIN